MVKYAHATGANAVVLTAPVLHNMDNYFLLRKTKKAIHPTTIIVKVRVGPYTKVEEVQELGIVNFINESELLAIIDEHFINKQTFEIPFRCGCTNLANALNRVNEGTSVLRIQGDSSNIADTVKIVKSLLGEIVALVDLDEAQLLAHATEIGAPSNQLMKTKQHGRLLMPFFAVGGIVTALDAVLMIRLDCDGVIVNSKVLVSKEPIAMAKKIMKAVIDAWRMVHSNGNRHCSK